MYKRSKDDFAYKREIKPLRDAKKKRLTNVVELSDTSGDTSDYTTDSGKETDEGKASTKESCCGKFDEAWHRRVHGFMLEMERRDIQGMLGSRPSLNMPSYPKKYVYVEMLKHMMQYFDLDLKKATDIIRQKYPHIVPEEFKKLYTEHPTSIDAYNAYLEEYNKLPNSKFDPLSDMGNGVSW